MSGWNVIQWDMWKCDPIRHAIQWWFWSFDLLFWVRHHWDPMRNVNMWSDKTSPRHHRDLAVIQLLLHRQEILDDGGEQPLHGSFWKYFPVASFCDRCDDAHVVFISKAMVKSWVLASVKVIDHVSKGVELGLHWKVRLVLLQSPFVTCCICSKEIQTISFHCLCVFSAEKTAMPFHCSEESCDHPQGRICQQHYGNVQHIIGVEAQPHCDQTAVVGFAFPFWHFPWCSFFCRHADHARCERWHSMNNTVLSAPLIKTIP